MKLKALFAWVAKASIALSLMYTALFVANSLGVTFYSLVGGGMLQQAVSRVVISESWDSVIWAGAVFFGLSYLLFSFYQKKVGDQRYLFLLFALSLFAIFSVFYEFGYLSLALASLFVVLICVKFSWMCFDASSLSVIKDLVLCSGLFLLFVQVASFVASFVLNSPIASTLTPNFLDGARHWVLLDLSFSNVVYPLLPLAYLFLVFLGVIGLLVKLGFIQKISAWLARQNIRSIFRFSGLFDDLQKEDFGFLNGRFPLVLALLVSVAVSSLLVVFTVLPWINPTYRLVSTDAPFYYQWLHNMRATDFNGAITQAFAGDRSFFMIILYLLSMAIPPLQLVQLLPIILIPLLSVFSFLITKHVGAPREALVYAVLLAPVSIQALGLIFSGYFANTFALILVYLFYVLYLWVLRKVSRLGIFSLIGVCVLILFSYPWAWFILALSLLTFLFMQWRFAVRDRSLWSDFKTKTILVGSSLFVSLLCDLVRRLLTATSSITIVYDTVNRDLAFPNLSLLWNGMKTTVDFYLGGALGSQLIVLLSIIGFLYILKSRSEMSALLTSWVFVSCVAILFTSSEFAYHKFLFSMPLVVFSSLGLSWLVRFVVHKSSGSKVRNSVGFMLISTVVFLILLCSALRFVSNLNVL